MNDQLHIVVVQHSAEDTMSHPPHSTEMCSGSEAGSYLRLIDSRITQLKAQ